MKWLMMILFAVQTLPAFAHATTYNSLHCSGYFGNKQIDKTLSLGAGQCELRIANLNGKSFAAIAIGPHGIPGVQLNIGQELSACHWSLNSLMTLISWGPTLSYIDNGSGVSLNCSLVP